MNFATWLFNPWDFGGAALTFAGLVAASSIALSPFRARLGGEFAGVPVAAFIVMVYMIGAIATAGFGPLAPLGAMMLFVPAAVIASLVMWAASQFRRMRQRGVG